jgi:hypothetical protein
MLSFTYAERHKLAVCAQYRYAECSYAECRGAGLEPSNMGTAVVQQLCSNHWTNKFDSKTVTSIFKFELFQKN